MGDKRFGTTHGRTHQHQQEQKMQLNSKTEKTNQHTVFFNQNSIYKKVETSHRLNYS